MSETDFTFDDVLHELAKLNHGGAEGFTIKEMEKATGKGAKWCRNKVKLLIDEEKLVCSGRRKVTGIDGRIFNVPTYKQVR